ncbi:MAG: sugar kinase [Clostridia bacterium]|nr:sugar kinase [Clostridia bacterium]
MMLDRSTLNDILARLPSVRVCVVGDLCLDAYWRADMRLSRLSRETPHHPLPVVSERYSPGGGGNVVANLAALGVGKVLPVSAVGPDWRGFLLRKCLKDVGVTEEYIAEGANIVTPCYCKPLRGGISDVVYEDPRLDFENRAPISEELEAAVLQNLESASENADVIAVCDQLEYGVVTPAVRKRLCELGKKMPVVADSRDRIALYENVIVKPNEVEAAAATGCPADAPALSAERLSEKNRAPAIVTVGEKGAYWCENGRAVLVPAVKTEPPIDIVGAGDTFLSAFCAAFASGAPGGTAVAFANLASSVTVGKIGVTGTATGDELRLALCRL